MTAARAAFNALNMMLIERSPRSLIGVGVGVPVQVGKRQECQRLCLLFSAEAVETREGRRARDGEEAGDLALDEC